MDRQDDHSVMFQQMCRCAEALGYLRSAAQRVVDEPLGDTFARERLRDALVESDRIMTGKPKQETKPDVR